MESGTFRRKGLKSRLWVQLLYFRCQTRVAPRTPPRSFFCRCILQTAIDFAVLESRTFFGVAGFAPKLNFQQTCGFKKIGGLLYPVMHSNILLKKKREYNDMSYNKTMREIPKDKILAYAAFYDFKNSLENSNDLKLEKDILKKAQKIDGAKDLFKFLLDKENGILKWKGALRIKRYFEDEEYWDSVRKESFLNEIKKSCDDWNVNKEIVKKLAENKDYRGISYPIASTLVYFFSKGNCPIIDWRTIRTLTDYGFNVRGDDWDGYFNTCLEIVNNCGISIRDLDKALWIYQDIKKKYLPICKCLSDLNIHE